MRQVSSWIDLLLEQIEILFQDEYLIAINKPAGLLTIQDGYKPYLPNLKSQLDDQFGKVYTVHRLDKETSGILIFAFSPDSHRKLSMDFENRKIKKEYRAVIIGDLYQDSLTIDLPLRVNGDRHHRTIVDHQRGKPSITQINFLKFHYTNSVVSAFPKTGYTHQIRAHLSAINHPIVNDPLYNPHQMDDQNYPQRLILHAYKITFLHPFNQQIIELTAPIPSELSFLER